MGQASRLQDVMSACQNLILLRQKGVPVQGPSISLLTVLPGEESRALPVRLGATPWIRQSLVGWGTHILSKWPKNLREHLKTEGGLHCKNNEAEGLMVLYSGCIRTSVIKKEQQRKNHDLMISWIDKSVCHRQAKIASGCRHLSFCLLSGCVNVRC